MSSSGEGSVESCSEYQQSEETPAVSDLSESLENSSYADDSSDRTGKQSIGTKRKRNQEQRVENEQTKKLRNRVDSSSEEEQEAETDEEEVGDEQVAVRQRYDEQQGVKELVIIRNMWQLAAIQDFFALLKSIGLWSSKVEFTLDELDTALVHSRGPGLLASLHMDILVGISPKSQVNSNNWVQYMCNRIKGCAEVNFVPKKGQEVEEYAVLSSSQRVLCLLSLCNVRAECDDFRSIIDNCIRPAATQKQANKNRSKYQSISNSVEQFRRQPLGYDSEGQGYFFLDLESIGAGVRMYCENIVWKGKKQKEYQWKWMAGDVECIRELGQQLGESNSEKDQELSTLILDGVVAVIEEQQENQRKQYRRARRLELNLNNIILGQGRQTRARKQVDYTFNHVFEEINKAINSEKYSCHDQPKRKQAQKVARFESGDVEECSNEKSEQGQSQLPSESISDDELQEKTFDTNQCNSVKDDDTINSQDLSGPLISDTNSISDAGTASSADQKYANHSMEQVNKSDYIGDSRGLDQSNVIKADIAVPLRLNNGDPRQLYNTDSLDDQEERVKNVKIEEDKQQLDSGAVAIPIVDVSSHDKRLQKQMTQTRDEALVGNGVGLRDEDAKQSLQLTMSKQQQQYERQDRNHISVLKKQDLPLWQNNGTNFLVSRDVDNYSQK
eukprot:TRINITY_DN6821_c0_g1_i1.p1 TRINITY_DN6821_c0_g1~~TRINITY_DN6821_c0_g1_i1.p1  ORF type:complete len:685 (-),score=68.96 TRINITY_DN6821_c0_g1_i1:265-2277(-)